METNSSDSFMTAKEAYEISISEKDKKINNIVNDCLFQIENSSRLGDTDCYLSRNGFCLPLTDVAHKVINRLRSLGYYVEYRPASRDLYISWNFKDSKKVQFKDKDKDNQFKDKNKDKDKRILKNILKYFISVFKGFKEWLRAHLFH